jgi:hypothetical protein
MSGVRSMLTATEPNVAPDEVSGSLDASASWEEHLEIGVEKATNGEGTPAWVNAVMAVAAFIVQQDEEPGDGGGGEVVLADE